jgi:hypothetical protein
MRWVVDGSATCSAVDRGLRVRVILNGMRLRDLLRLLRRRGTGPAPAEQDRYHDAERTEQKTQAHYRSVTDTDARGRSTKRP